MQPPPVASALSAELRGRNSFARAPAGASVAAAGRPVPAVGGARLQVRAAGECQAGAPGDLRAPRQLPRLLGRPEATMADHADDPGGWGVCTSAYIASAAMYGVRVGSLG